jgi:archaemetzincin
MPNDRGAERFSELRFVPLAGLGAEEAQALVAHTSAHVSATCRLLEPPAGLALEIIPGRDQIDADRLLAELERLAGEDGGPVVGIAGRDLAIPIFTFVFGRARLGGRAALVSLERLRPEFHGEPPDSSLTTRRLIAEILHELGHVAGLPHCPDASCLMYFASSVERIDLRGLAFCANCAPALPPALRREGEVAAEEW